MAATTTTQGDLAVLNSITNKAGQGNLILRLFVSNTTPAKADTTSTYTECSASGYSAITLTGASWTIASNEDGTATASYAEQTFTFTASATVYGYYLTNNAGTSVVFAEEFSDGPYAIPSGGGSVKVTVSYSAN